MLPGAIHSLREVYCSPAAFAADSISVFVSSGVSTGAGSSGASATPGATLPPQPILDKTKRDSTDMNKNGFRIAEAFSKLKMNSKHSQQDFD